MTKFAMISVLAASLALVACQPAETASVPENLEPMPQALPVRTEPNTASTQAVPRPPIQATELGSINGCIFHRVIVDGKPFVLASAYWTDYTSSSAVRTCELEPLS